MMEWIKYTFERVPRSMLARCPDNARANPDAGKVLERAADLRANGQIYPMIGYREGERIMVVDGGIRLEAAARAGIEEMTVLICERRPTRAEVLALQTRNEVHHTKFTSMELSHLLANLQAETKCTVTELAEMVKKSQPFVSKALALQKLDPTIQQMVHEGKLKAEPAYMIASSEPTDCARQLAMVAGTARLSREQLRRRSKCGGQSAEPKLPAVKLPLAGKMLVTLKGPDLTIGVVAEVLHEAARQVKKAQGYGHDLRSVGRYFRDTAKSSRPPKDAQL